MAFVQRANVILEVSDDDVDYYYNKGYNQIDAQGNIVKEAIPTDVYVLQSAYMRHIHDIEELKSENENLKKQLAKKTKKEN